MIEGIAVGISLYHFMVYGFFLVIVIREATNME